MTVTHKQAEPAGGTLLTLPVKDTRLMPLAAAPRDAAVLLRTAIEAVEALGALIAKAAPAPEITAAAEAVASLRMPLASLGLVSDVLCAAYDSGVADASRRRSPLSLVPADRTGRSERTGA